jgi:hypothetical protein
MIRAPWIARECEDRGDDGPVSIAIAPIRFDYSAVAADVAGQMRAAAHHIQQLLHAAHYDVGRELLGIKKQIEHGQFIDWVERECQMQIRTAERAMMAADMVEKNDNLSYLPQDGVLALAARSTPAPVVNQIIERVDAGERPSAAQIKEQIAAAKLRALSAAEATRRGAGRRRKVVAEQQQKENWQVQAARREEARNAASYAAGVIAVDRLGDRLGEVVALVGKGDLWRFFQFLRKAAADPAVAAAAATVGGENSVVVADESWCGRL